METSCRAAAGPELPAGIYRITHPPPQRAQSTHGAGLACPVPWACNAPCGRAAQLPSPQAGHFWDLLPFWHQPACHILLSRSQSVTDTGLAAQSVRMSKQVCSFSTRRIYLGEDAASHRLSIISPAHMAEVDIVSWCLTSFKLFFPSCFLSFSEESNPFALSE